MLAIVAAQGGRNPRLLCWPFSLRLPAPQFAPFPYNTRMRGMRTFTFLGTGTSVGVPMLGCDCPVCLSDNPRNHRNRCAVLVGTPQGNILIDTPPELRLPLLREKVRLVHAVLFTHYHADHLFGLDDVRPFPRLLGGPVPIYCTEEVEEKIRTAFPYAFGREVEQLPAGYVPKLEFRRIGSGPFQVLDEPVVPDPIDPWPFPCTGVPDG